MDKRIKRGGTTAILAAVIGTMAGCSDYPSEGELNTQDVRRNFQVIEISGDVYGVTEDTIEAGRAFVEDVNTLEDFPSRFWEAHLADNDLPELDLQYPGIDSSDIEDLAARLEGVAEQDEQSIRDRIASKVEEAKATRDEHARIVEENREKLEAFEAADDEAAAKLKTVREKHTEALKAYQEALNAPMDEINALLRANGIQELHPEHGNPLKDYLYVNREQGVDGPGCDNKVLRIVVDARAELNKCLIFRRSSNYKAVWDEMRPILLQAAVQFEQAAEKLGQKGGFFKDPTGLYAELDEAEDAYARARSAASREFGSAQQLKYNIEQGEQRVEQAQTRIESLSSERHIAKILNQHMLRVGQDDSQTVKDYVKAMRTDILSQLEHVSDLEPTEDESATFSDVPGGYHGLLVSGEMLLSRGAGRVSGVFTDYVDLTDEAVATADVIESTVTSRSLSDRVRYSDSERMDDKRFKTLLGAVGDANND